MAKAKNLNDKNKINPEELEDYEEGYISPAEALEIFATADYKETVTIGNDAIVDNAINYLINIAKTRDDKSITEKEYTEAVNMAIEALEQEPCEDCIRRQAVLDYIYNDLGLGDEENGKDVERHIELERSYRFVKSLPPVSPQPKIELDC